MRGTPNGSPERRDRGKILQSEPTSQGRRPRRVPERQDRRGRGHNRRTPRPAGPDDPPAHSGAPSRMTDGRGGGSRSWPIPHPRRLVLHRSRTSVRHDPRPEPLLEACPPKTSRPGPSPRLRPQTIGSVLPTDLHRHPVGERREGTVDEDRDPTPRPGGVGTHSCDHNRTRLDHEPSFPRSRGSNPLRPVRSRCSGPLTRVVPSRRGPTPTKDLPPRVAPDPNPVGRVDGHRRHRVRVSVLRRRGDTRRRPLLPRWLGHCFGYRKTPSPRQVWSEIKFLV